MNEQQACNSCRLDCLNIDIFSRDDFSAYCQEIRIPFELEIYNSEYIFWIPILEWINSVCSCKVLDIKILQDGAKLSGTFQDGVLLIELRYIPCKRRNYL